MRPLSTVHEYEPPVAELVRTVGAPRLSADPLRREISAGYGRKRSVSTATISIDHERFQRTEPSPPAKVTGTVWPAVTDLKLMVKAMRPPLWAATELARAKAPRRRLLAKSMLTDIKILMSRY